MEPQPNYRAPQPDDWAPQLRRPQGQDPPHDRRLDNTHSLDVHSLRALMPWRWLDDDVVNTFLRCLCSMQPGQFVTLDSTVLESLHIMASDEQGVAPEAFAENLKSLRTLAATVSGNSGLVFLPFCLDHHWILAVADLRHRLIRIYDSLVQCDRSGRVEMSWNVGNVVIPMAKDILAFCVDADQWTVELFWLPIKSNITECGVYICLMALQHCYNRRFTTYDYVAIFRNEDGELIDYQLDECYWLTGRRIILRVCANFFLLADESVLSLGDDFIARRLRHFFDKAPVQQFYGPNTYRMARSWTLRRVSDALAWASNSIASLAYPQNLHLNAWIHSRARHPVLTLAWEQFRNDIVEEAVRYAWHDPKPLVRLMWDLNDAMNTLIQEDQNSEIRLANRLARQAQLVQACTTSVQASSGDDSDTSSAVVELEATSPAPGTMDVETPSPARPESPSTSEAEQPEAES